MTTVATDLVHAVTKFYGTSGAATYHGITKREYGAAVIMNGFLRDADNVGVLTDAQIAAIAVARTDAALAAAGADGDDLAFPPAEFRNPGIPSASQKNGLTKLEWALIDFMSGFQGDNISIDALNPLPTAPTDNLAGVGAGNVDHVPILGAPTVALQAPPAAGNVNLITVPVAPTAALAGAGAGNVPSYPVPIAPTAALAGLGAGNVDDITPPIAPTMVEGAAGNVDVGSHWYVVTYQTADGETIMGTISAEIAIAGAAKHVTVTIPVSPYAGVTGRRIWRTKIAGGHVARTDFFLVGAVANNTDVAYDDNLAEAGMPADNPPAASNAASYKYIATYTTVDGETLMGAIQAVAVVVADKAANGQVTVTIPVSGEPNVTSRKIYRCKAGMASLAAVRTDFFLVGSVADNVTVTFTDNIAEGAIGANPPAANNAAQFKYLVTYTAADGTETSIGAIQAAAVVVADNTADGQVTVTIPVSLEAGVTGRKVYRSKAGGAKAARTDFFLMATVANNVDVSTTDNLADAGLGANPPAANATGGHKYVVTAVTVDGETLMGTISALVTIADPSVNGRVALSAIPVSVIPSVTSRKVYRSKAGTDPTLRTHFFLLTTIADNVTVTFEDNVADSGLGANPPAANTAGSYSYKVTHVSASGESEASAASGGVIVADKAADGKIALTVIPTGPVGTLSRKIYRTKCGKGSIGPWYYHSTIADNVTVVATDNTNDSSLGTATAPSTDTAWAGILAVDVDDKADKFIAHLGSTANDPVVPFRFYVAAGAMVYKGQTKEEFFSQAAESGFISDSVNIGVLTNAQLATKGHSLGSELITALNAP